ncbi:hypothetical protein MKW92_051075 [Papaver armeniacum]|nr:hypothetical protein MKW92_051075 [Papaver armeniacum]
MAIRSGTNPEKIHGVKIFGAALVQPYFSSGVEPILEDKFNVFSKEGPAKLWYNVCPSTTGVRSLINPTTDMNLSRLGYVLKDIGWVYFETLKNCGWGGVVEIMESQGENHVPLD